MHQERLGGRRDPAPSAAAGEQEACAGVKHCWSAPPPYGRHVQICEIVPPWCPAMILNGTWLSASSAPRFQSRMLSNEPLHRQRRTALWRTYHTMCRSLGIILTALTGPLSRGSRRLRRQCGLVPPAARPEAVGGRVSSSVAWMSGSMRMSHSSTVSLRRPT